MNTKVNPTRILLFVVDNIIWFIAALVLAVFTLSNPLMLTFGNMMGALYSVSMIGFLVFAQATALISGNFDLSIGAIACFSSTVAALLYLSWMPGAPWWLLIAVMIITGACIGLYNGILIAKVGVNAFLQTLGTYLVLYGSVVLLAGRTLFGLPGELLFAGGYSIGGIGGVPLAVVILLLATVILHLFYSRMPLGRKIYAVGSNRVAARACGINVEKTLIMTFVISGILSAIAGLLYLGYMGCVPMAMAMPDLFPSFAGAIIGGVSLKGGRGKMSGVLGGIVLLGILQVGMVLLDVPAQTRAAISGFVLVFAIMINTFQAKAKIYLLSRLESK